MAERFERLFYLPENLYIKTSPVLIRTGALTIDRESGKLFAQLKLENISDKIIRSVKASFYLFDTAKRPLGEPVIFEYLDLNCARDDSFGGKTAIPMSDNHARSFTASVTEVVFTDGEIWSEERAEWRAIPKPRELSEIFGHENADAFPILFGKQGEYLPLEQDDLWLCACGAVNRDAENVCHVCKKPLADLKAITQEQVAEQTETIRKDEIYDQARRLMEQKTIPSYEEAIRQFESIPDWKDAGEKIPECKRAIEQLRVSAEKRAKKSKKLAAIITPIVVTCIAFLIVLTTVIIPSSKYNSAISLIEEGKYVEAYEALIDLNYKDSAAKAKETLGQYIAEKLKTAKVGDYVVFGSYEQDNNTSNGKEDVEWLVLAKEGDKALVISRYALDCQQYNTSYTDVTWETCSLRKWLNGTFISNAFSSDEQNMIQSTTVTADKNPSYSTSPGNNTTDKVFLLSITEVNKYFNSDDARKCAPTDYAIAQGAWTSDSHKTGSRATCWWWLRSPGGSSSLAAGVGSGGSVSRGGSSVSYDRAAVRPAMWIDLSE